MRTLNIFIGTIKRTEWVCRIYFLYGVMLNCNHCILNEECKLSRVTWLVRNSGSTLWNEIVIGCNKTSKTILDVNSVLLLTCIQNIWETNSKKLEVKQTASQPDYYSNEGMRQRTSLGRATSKTASQRNQKCQFYLYPKAGQVKSDYFISCLNWFL